MKEGEKEEGMKEKEIMEERKIGRREGGMEVKEERTIKNKAKERKKRR